MCMCVFVFMSMTANNHKRPEKGSESPVAAVTVVVSHLTWVLETDVLWESSKYSPPPSPAPSCFLRQTLNLEFTNLSRLASELSASPALGSQMHINTPGFPNMGLGD